MTQPQKTPAERILARFGPGRIAKWTGRHRSRVHAWPWPPEKGGTGGVIPVRVRPAIIAGALRDLGETVAHSEFELAEGETYLVAEEIIGGVAS